MYEEAVIKEFETSKIKVITIVYEEFTARTVILPLLVFVIVSGFFYIAYTSNSSNAPVDVVMVVTTIGVAAVIGLMTVLMAAIFGWGYNHIPSYQVSLVGRNNSMFDHEISQTENIIIPITTLEKDQVAICKAAQSLEPIAQEFDEKARAIKKIADKCKEVKA
jgi:hypothetical protein